MVNIMEEPREAIRRARTAAGLSVRALAEIAGISPTTVTRVEAGRVDPVWSMLRKILAAAGEGAALITRRLPATLDRSPSSPTLAGLSDAWQRTAARGDTPNWTGLRGALDVLAQHPELAHHQRQRDRRRMTGPPRRPVCIATG